jgi:hypothetical protein
MSLSGSTWDDLFCWVSGGDPEYFYLDDDIAADERRVARAYGISILSVTLINFICTALGIHEAFIQLREVLSAPIYIGWIVLPFALFWSALLLSLLRFTIQTGYEHDEDWLGRIKRVLFSMPVWLVFPTLGFAAAIPLQTAALSDDIRFAAVVKHWEDMGPALLNVHLQHAIVSDKPHHACLKPLMTPQVFNNLEDAAQRLGVCRALVDTVAASASAAAPNATSEIDTAYSIRLLDTVRTHLYADGLISRAEHAFAVAPGASWLLVLVMMAIYSAPYLTRLLARKRAYEYWRYDHHRQRLARTAHIELHAHDVFDAKGNAIALHRYHGAEYAQRQMHERFEREQKEAQDRLESARAAVQKTL